MKLGLANFYNAETAALEVEAVVTYETGGSQPLSGQVFYLLDKSASDIISLLSTDHEKALETLRSTALKFIITDSRGKAKISGLQTGTYFICGVRQTQKGIDVWNVKVDLKPGKNSLVLDNRNMTRRKF